MARLTATSLTCLRGPRLVFEGLDFSLDAGDALLLTGPNGSGKSSLLRLLAGLLSPLDGQITANGRPISDDMEGHRAATAYLGHLDPVKPTLSVQENARFWATLLGTPDRVDAALATLNLTELAALSGRVLSSGQRRRLSLTRLLLSPADLWLLDEPTVGLDTNAVAAVEQMVVDHRAQGGVVILSTHIEFQLPGAKTLDLGDFTPAAFRSEAPV
jgi:heme exporter protein A